MRRERAFQSARFSHREPEAPIILRVSQNDDDVFAAVAQAIQAAANEPASDTLALMTRQDSYWRQCHSGSRSGGIVDPHSAEQNVTRDFFIYLCDEREKYRALAPQTIDKVSLVAPFECRLVHATYGGLILRGLATNDYFRGVGHQGILTRIPCGSMTNQCCLGWNEL